MPGAHDLATPQARECGGGAGAGKSCVLVVEDESALRWLVARVLKDEGHTVLEASDGAQALELLEGEVCGIDLVLTDVRMPVVYMSADPPAALVGGASGVSTPPCLQKPFSLTALVAMVDRLLGGTAKRAAVEESLASA